MSAFLSKISAFFSKVYCQDVKIKIIISAAYFFAALLIFSFFRFLLLCSYPEIFSQLSIGDKLFAFLCGMRFDLSVISLVSSLWLLILFLPLKSKKVIKFTVFMMCFSILVMVLLLCGDFFYFPEVKRHMTDDILIAWTEREFIFDYILRIYWWLLLIIFIAAAAVLTVFSKLINRYHSPKPVSLLKSVLLIVLLGAVLIIFIRGKLGGGRPLNVEDVYRAANSVPQATLISNGIFSQYQAINKRDNVFNNNYPKEEAFEKAKAFLFGRNEIAVDDEYPLMRRITGNGPLKKYNIVIVMLESWTPQYIDSISGSDYGVTPNFDKIVEGGVFFSNAYSSGSRSIYGICGALLGVPVMPGMMLLGYGLEVNTNMTSMFETFNRNDYYTMYIQSSSRKSLKMCDIAKNIFHAGESYGKEDMVLSLQYGDDIYSGYDYEMLDFVSDKADLCHKQGTPFYMFAFTGTTHSPFIQTTKEFQKYPADTDEGRYLNNLYYADHAIGNLIENAKRSGYFNDTVFIFMADHILTSLQRDDKIIEKFKIPFVIYAPEILEEQKIDYVVSQADLMPTIYNLLNITEPYSSLGTNALEPEAAHFALINDGGNIVFIDDSGYMRHNRLKSLESSFPSGSPEFADMEDKIKYLDKAVTETVKYNKWFKPMKEIGNE